MNTTVHAEYENVVGHRIDVEGAGSFEDWIVPVSNGEGGLIALPMRFVNTAEVPIDALYVLRYVDPLGPYTLDNPGDDTPCHGSNSPAKPS